MQAPIYRNLDQPLRILGFQASQLVALAFVLVVGGEVATYLGVHRLWAFAFFVFLAFLFFSVNRALGIHYMSRLIRFLALPRILPRQIVSRRRWH